MTETSKEELQQMNAVLDDDVYDNVVVLSINAVVSGESLTMNWKLGMEKL